MAYGKIAPCRQGASKPGLRLMPPAAREACPDSSDLRQDRPPSVPWRIARHEPVRNNVRVDRDLPVEESFW
jgi:hypothetical protein